jgi:hypothetical protein
MVDDLKQGGLQAFGAADLFNPGLAPCRMACAQPSETALAMEERVF